MELKKEPNENVRDKYDNNETIETRMRSTQTKKNWTQIHKYIAEVLNGIYIG